MCARCHHPETLNLLCSCPPSTSLAPLGHTGGVAKCSILPYGAATSFFDKSAGDFTGRRWVRARGVGTEERLRTGGRP